MTTLHLFMKFCDNITHFHDILWQHCIFSWHFMTTLHLFMKYVMSYNLLKRCNVVIKCHEKMQCCHKISWKDVMLSQNFIKRILCHNILWQHCIFSWHFMTTLHLFMTFYDNITSFHDILWQHCIFSWHFISWKCVMLS
jgi:hypothetical protein